MSNLEKLEIFEPIGAKICLCQIILNIFKKMSEKISTLTPRRQVVLELEAERFVGVFNQVNYFFVLETLGFNSIY